MHGNPCIPCAIKNVFQNEYRCRWRMVHDELGGPEAQGIAHGIAHHAFHILEKIETTESGLDNSKRIKKFNIQKKLKELDPKIRKIYNKLFVLVEDFRLLSSSESKLYKKFKLVYVEEEVFLNKKNRLLIKQHVVYNEVLELFDKCPKSKRAKLPKVIDQFRLELWEAYSVKSRSKTES